MFNRKAFEKLASPIKIQFIHKHPETKELQPAKANLFLPIHLLAAEEHSPYHILTYYEECVKTLEEAVNPKTQVRKKRK